MSKLIDRTGEEKLMNNGQKAKIIVYRGRKDIDIEFEDGTIVEHKQYICFKTGEIANPNYNYKHNKKIIRLGEQKLMQNGKSAKVIVYRNCKDIDIEFEDGIIVQHQRYENFKNGKLSNPTYKPKCKLKLCEERVMNNGQKARLKVCRCFNDIDIEFEDGTLLEHTRYDSFKKGQIANPNYNPNSKLGEEMVMNNGQKAKIVVYRNYNDIALEFEDGTVLKHRSYGNFKKRCTVNPNLTNGGKVGSFRIIKKIFTKIDEETKEVKFVLWQCKCERCGYESLITPQMMLKHKC